MNKLTLIILGFLFATSSFGQNFSDSITVSCELISGGEGSKIHIAKYKIHGVLKGEPTNDTISVGYYFYTLNGELPKYSTLSLIKYKGDSTLKDYYIFPDYDINKGFPEYRQLIDSALKDSLQLKIENPRTVENQKSAISIAETILFKSFEKGNILEQRPYVVILIDGYWIINGTLKEGMKGGTFLLVMDSKNGDVLKLTHGK